MTRKDFILIANAVSSARSVLIHNVQKNDGDNALQEMETINRCIRSVVVHLCSALQYTDDKFDRDRFTKACLIEEG